MTGFVVYAYEHEINFLKSLVRREENIETGGDLFGLWLTTNEVVIQLISGPGENCERTPISFHQDIRYLENVGTHLTTKQGLCNVGEWHSHHRLGLAKPSLGDEQTVWRSMPPGLTKFVLFIANIRGSKSNKEPEVNIGCFLFDNISHEVVPGTFVSLSEPCSPLRKNKEIEKVLKDGAEEPRQKQEPPKNRNRNKRKKGKSPAGAGSFEDNSEVFCEKDNGEMKGTRNGGKTRKKRKSKVVKKEEKKNGMEEKNEETGNDDKDKEIILDDAQEEKNKTEDMDRNEEESNTKEEELAEKKRNKTASGKKSNTKEEEKELAEKKRNETASGKKSNNNLEEKEAASGKKSNTKVEEKELAEKKRNVDCKCERSQTITWKKKLKAAS